MDSDEEYSDFESQESYEIDDNEPKAMQPSFETLTANDIVELMNQFIENVNAVIQVSRSVAVCTSKQVSLYMKQYK